MSPYTQQELEKAHDIAVANLFSGKDKLLAAVYCNLESSWDLNIPTACTNGKYIKWNPDWFMQLPPATRNDVLVHEIDHVAKLHMIRRGSRDPRIWNYACDFRNNNDRWAEGHKFSGTNPLLDIQRFGPDMSEEEIYEVLLAEGIDGLENDLGDDIELGTPTDIEIGQQIQVVQRAHQTVKHLGGKGVSPAVEQLIKGYLSPAVPWEEVLYQWFTDLQEQDYSFKRPNRRFDIALPGLVDVGERLERLNYYPDASGSITLAQLQRINTELKFIKETFNPQELHICLFDTEITKEILVTEDEAFDSITIVGGGGTCLECVRQHIIATKPSGAIVLSDMHCLPMGPIPEDIPVVWVCMDNPDATVPFGTLIHVSK